MKHWITANSRLFVYPTLLSAYLVLLCPIGTAQANTFRWVDKNGQVHYSDRIPPDDVDRAYSIINKQGVTVNSVEQAKTKEQLKEQKRLEEQQAKEAQAERDRQIHDHILLDTYTNVKDLEDTRDRYVATLEGLIKVAQHKLANLNNDLEKLNKTAANMERDGKALPKDMQQDIANIQKQIDRENNFILSQRTQQKEVRIKFAADIKRYQELKAMQQSTK